MIDKISAQIAQNLLTAQALDEKDINLYQYAMLFYYIKDINNTIIAVVSEDGEVADAFEYDDFGMPIQRDYADFAYLSALNPLMYRDYIYDFESQMYYVKSRYYMPAVSRYANADLSFGRDNHTILSTNLYLYCDNDPINKTAK